MRTTPGPSLTAPALRHASSASRRHGSRSAKKKPPLQPVSTPRTPKPMEPTRYQRTPRAMAATMRRMLLTTLQRFARLRPALAGAAPVWLRRISTNECAEDTQAMEAKSRLILAALMSSVMVAMVTFIVTVLDLGLRSGFLLKWLKAYLIAWPVAWITAFIIMPPARRLTERIVALLDGRR